jgi:Flp pilus assembly protein TadD
MIIRALRDPLNALILLDMRFVRYILPFVVLLASVVLTPSVCSAQRQRAIERTTLPDSLGRSYRHAEAVKRLSIDGDTVAAREIWQSLIAEDSTYAPALYNLHLLEDDALKALSYAHRAYASDTTNRWYARGYATSLVATRKYTQAIPAYRRLMRLSPNDIEAYHALALLYSYCSMPYSAISILDSAELRVGFNPYLGEIKLHLLIDTRQYERAIATGVKGVNEQPYDINARINLAEAYEVAGRDSLARTTLEEALHIDSANIEALSALSSYYERRGETRRMLDYEERIFANEDIAVGEKLNRIEQFTSNRAFYSKNYIRIGSIIQRLAIAYPNDRDVVDCYAGHMIALGDLEKAAEYLYRHLDNTATTARHYIELMTLLTYLEDGKGALDVLISALERYPRDVELLAYAGYYCVSNGDFKGAKTFYKEGVSVAMNDEERSKMWGYIGDVYHEEGRDTKAFRAYRKALSYDKDNVMVLNNYAYFLSLLDKHLDMALTMAERAMTLEPGEASYIDTYAWVLHRLGRNEEAKSVMMQALSISAHREASLLAHYADILWALGEKFMADTYWKKAVEQGYDKEEMEQHISHLKGTATKDKKK